MRIAQTNISLTRLSLLRDAGDLLARGERKKLLPLTNTNSSIFSPAAIGRSVLASAGLSCAGSWCTLPAGPAPGGTRNDLVAGKPNAS
jgi:hypothetical protein